jgi:hypothetical protein
MCRSDGSSKLSGVEVSAVAPSGGGVGAGFWGSEALGVAGDGLDDPIGPFRACVGNAGGQGRQYVWPPGLDGGGEAVEFGRSEAAQRV